MKTHELKMANWARIEQRHKIWVERWERFCAEVRGIFILLLLTTILVFVYNHQVLLQNAASAGLQQATKKVTASDKFREQALKHEKEVDQINQ